MDDYAEKSSQIRQLASLPPDQLIDHLSNLHPNLDSVAPNLAPHIHSAASNAIQFLNNKLPLGNDELLQDKYTEPSKGVKNQWLSLHKIVNDPVSILDHVRNNTLNNHHLEALQSVYPDLHQEMIQKIQERLGGMKLKKEQLPYSKRLTLSNFIGQPLDSSMTLGSMQAIINSASQNNGPAQAAANRPKKASGTELTEINRVNAIYQTGSQARQLQKRS